MNPPHSPGRLLHPLTCKRYLRREGGQPVLQSAESLQIALYPPSPPLTCKRYLRREGGQPVLQSTESLQIALYPPSPPLTCKRYLRGEGGQPVLQSTESLQIVPRQQVRARGKSLPDLDERGAAGEGEEERKWNEEIRSPTSTVLTLVYSAGCPRPLYPLYPPAHPRPLSRLRSSLALFGVFFSREPVAASPNRLVMNAPNVADTCMARPYTWEGGKMKKGEVDSSGGATGRFPWLVCHTSPHILTPGAT